MYKAIRTKMGSLQPEIVEVSFEIFEDSGQEFIRPKPGVTGYERGQLKKMVDEYAKGDVFSRWIACAGTLNQYDRLEIPMSEIIRWLEETGRIEVKRKFGYVEEIIWKDR